MSLFFRLLWTMMFSRFRKPCDFLGPCRTGFRVWPTDLDGLGHVNNGRYLTILDLARVDLMIRSRMLGKVQAKKWYPIVIGQGIEFKKSLRVFERFEVETTLLGWDEKTIFLEQKFLTWGARVVGDRAAAPTTVAACALIRARFLKKSGGSVSSEELLKVVSNPPPVGHLPQWVRDWDQAQSILRKG